MDALNYMRSTVNDQSRTFDVYRNQGGYSSDYQKVDVVDCAVFSPSSSSLTVAEGKGEDTSITGLVVPDDTTDSPRVTVNDQLRLQSNESKRYSVETKDGLPNEINPELWRLGLSHANSSN